MALVQQSQKAKKLNSVICIMDSVKHSHVTACRSDSDPAMNYQQRITFDHAEMHDGHKVIVYTVTCDKVTGKSDTGLEPCQGSCSCKTLCKHSLAGVRAVVKAKGKKLYTASTLKLARKRGGQLVKLVGKSGYVWGSVK